MEKAEERAKIEVNFAGTTFNIEGPESLVREGWEYLKNELMPYLRGKTKEARPVKKRKMPELEKEKVEKIPEEELLKFYNEKKPKSQVATVTVFAYYLKHFKGKEEFTTTDIKDLYETLKLPVPKKYSQAIWDASSKRGFVIKGEKKGLYKISEAGERFVEEKLPKK